MATAKNTLAELKELIDTDLSDTTLNVALNTAAVVRQENIDNEGLGDDVVKTIELYLAAHFVYSGPEFQANQEKIGDWSSSYIIEGGKGLEATTYGQQAKLLDSTGNLANIDREDRGTPFIHSGTGRGEV